MSRLLSEAIAAFTTNGVPVANVRFRGEEAPAPPYAEAYLEDSTSTYSDNRNSRTLYDYSIVLYVAERDFSLEFAIEDALDAAQITWRKRGGYHADLDLVTTSYEFSVYER